MNFEFRAVIACPLAEVFAFFRDMDQQARQEDSVVPVYDKVTPGPTGVGTRYREVVRLLPGLTAEIRSEITAFEPERHLAYRFSGLGMDGVLNYYLEATELGTLVVQRQSLYPRGLLKLFNPLIEAAFSRAAGGRLQGIKALLEG